MPTSPGLMHPLLLAMLAVLPFVRTLRGEFLFDDPIIFEGGIPGLGPPASSPVMFRRFWVQRRALTAIIDGWLWRCFGVDGAVDLDTMAIRQPSWPWHASNLLTHLLAVLSLNVLIEPLIGPERAFLASTVFAIHPLQASSVAYISGRAGMQSALFSIWGLTEAYLGGWHWILAGVSQYLAWKSKEDAALYLIFYPVILFFR